MAGIDPISNVVDAAQKILSIFVASKTVTVSNEFELQKAELQGQIQIILAQLQVNAVEAASKSVFVAGWRPYIGWVCGTALGIPVFTYFLQCAIMLYHGQYNLPTYNSAELVTILIGLLGLGGMRTYEKVQGKASPGDVGH